MPIYQLLAQNKFILPPGTPADAADNTVGGMLMAQFAEKGWTWAANAVQIMDSFHNQMEMFWKWDPSRMMGAGAALLDGTPMSGYCGQLAHAFEALLRSPAPYGFGLAAETKEYQPTTELFIANHLGPVFNLGANVLRNDWASQGRPFLPLYAWGNHIVVLESGKYYDPCYNAVYNTLQQMARFSVKYDKPRLDKGRMLFETATVTATTGASYSFGITQQGSTARSRHPLAILIAPGGLPA
jgi:hypothetical protein